MHFLRSSRHQNWPLGLLLFAGTLIAYQPAWKAGFIWDDETYIINNELLTAPDGLKRIWFSLDSPSQYFPMVYTTFRIEHALWGLDPAGYHWVNILLHAANALLLWRLLKRLNMPGAWLAAALFALHPVHVESVAWITERKNVLSLFFSLLTALAWVAFVEAKPGRSGRFYALALAFYALALFSKSTACTLPAGLLLILWLNENPIGRRRLAQITPFLVMGLAMGLLAMWWERYHQYVVGREFSLALPERILVASHAVWFYLGKLLWPVNLTFSYPRWTLDPADPLSYGWLAAGAGSVAAIGLARRSLGRGIEVAALFYVATLSPMLGFIMLYTFRYTFVADHYQYVASIGPLALAAAAITRASAPWVPRKPLLKSALCGGMLLTLAVLTWRQSGMYKNPETLWRTTLARNPSSWMANNNLGNMLARRGQVAAAIPYLKKARELHSDDPKASYNLGVLLLRMGRSNEALAYFEAALRLDPSFSGSSDPVILQALAAAHAGAGQFPEAIETAQRALQFATAQGSATLVEALRAQLRLYEGGLAVP